MGTREALEQLCVEAPINQDATDRVLAAYDEDDEEAEEQETCTAELQDGGVCGRDRPCQYHDE